MGSGRKPIALERGWGLEVGAKVIARPSNGLRTLEEFPLKFQ
jgi:hypothetical protein